MTCIPLERKTYAAPLSLIIPFVPERSVLSGIEGEPIGWDEEIEL